MGDNLNEYIEEELGRIFEQIFETGRKNGFTVESIKDDYEFDNYSLLIEEVWNICDYIKFGSIVSLYEEWIKGLED